MWKSVDTGKETLECCKQKSMDDAGGSSGDWNPGKNMNSEGLAHEIS